VRQYWFQASGEEESNRSKTSKYWPTKLAKRAPHLSPVLSRPYLASGTDRTQVEYVQGRLSAYSRLSLSAQEVIQLLGRADRNRGYHGNPQGSKELRGLCGPIDYLGTCSERVNVCLSSLGSPQRAASTMRRELLTKRSQDKPL
jgi:hypothetical protein